MNILKLTKDITLYKSQFDSFNLARTGGYELDRVSLELDSILFRTKYEIRKGYGECINETSKSEFTEKAMYLRKLFGEFMYDFLTDIITIPENSHLEDIIDVLAQDVKINSNYVSFTMILLSENKSYLAFVDSAIPENEVFNMFPTEYFRFQTDSYNDAISKAFPELFEKRHQDQVGTGADGDVFVHNLTFQTTERCSLNCTYCYQFNKTPMRMQFETAKKFIDHLLADDYGYINRYNSPAIIIEFIGGEPLLEIKLTRQIYEYFLDRCYELNHPWFTMHRLSICSNGLQYFDDDVQSFFKDYSQNISFNISIDGNKALHDSCRIQPNGEGSYDIAMAALNHFNKHYTSERNSKMTLAPSNIKYLFDSVKDFIDHDMKCINLNCVFEEGWTRETAKTEYYQLKKLADYIIDNGLENIYIAIFNERQEDVHDKYQDSASCGGSGSMTALRPNGQIYPCIRYMPTSVGNDVADLCMGSVDEGWNDRSSGSEVIKMLDRITRRSYTNDICFECPISNSCASCTALGHAVYGTPNKKTSFHCIQHIAEALANVYYWNRLKLEHPDWNIQYRRNVVPRAWSLLILDEEELNRLTVLEMNAAVIDSATIRYFN